jgi:MSHA pilin protein MshC
VNLDGLAGDFCGISKLSAPANMSSRMQWNKAFQRGFTLVELVMTIVIVGILAAVAAPRFYNNNVFQSRGFADQVQATLRYAQKEAIAQHRNVCVTITASAITLNIATLSGAASPCNTNLASPAGQLSNCPSPTYKICTPSSTIVISSFPAPFNFDALGKPFDTLGTTPSTAQKSIAISGATNNIFIEAETGYVHSP